ILAYIEPVITPTSTGGGVKLVIYSVNANGQPTPAATLTPGLPSYPYFVAVASGNFDGTGRASVAPVAQTYAEVDLFPFGAPSSAPSLGNLKQVALFPIAKWNITAEGGYTSSSQVPYLGRVAIVAAPFLPVETASGAQVGVDQVAVVWQKWPSN